MNNQAIANQYHASLQMVRNAVETCTEDLWDASVGRHPFWLIAYHALYYADLYLDQDENTFQPPAFGREDEHYMEKRPFEPFDPIEPGEPYPQQQLLDYETHCRARVNEIVLSETAESLAADAGFSWIPFSRFELHFYNIRHIQHHAAQLSLELKFQTGTGVDWIGVVD